MTRDDFKVILEPLVLAMRVDFDVPTWIAYFRALEDVPAALLAHTVDALMREPLEFFPSAPKLRTAAERQRRVLLAAHPYDGCCECEDQRGWRAVLHDGAPKVERCPCVARHQDKLLRMGLAEPITQLPGEETRENEAVYPTLAQLPGPVRQQLTAIAGQKVLK